MVTVAASIVTILTLFANQVKAKGAWDYKYKPSWDRDFAGLPFIHQDNYVDVKEPEAKFIINNELRKLADLANINFGYTGKTAKIPENVLKFGAGVAQLQKNTNSWIKAAYDAWKTGEEGRYGDEDDDAAMVVQGIRWAKNGIPY